MDLRFSPAENAFREEMRRFFTTEVPAAIRKKVAEGRHLDKAESRYLQRDVATEGQAYKCRCALGHDDSRAGRDLSRLAIPAKLHLVRYVESFNTARHNALLLWKCFCLPLPIATLRSLR